MSAANCKASDYLKFVQTSKLHAYVIQDEKLLPHNKRDLLESIYWRLRLDFRKRDSELLCTLARSVASYQYGVGSRPVYFNDQGDMGCKLQQLVMKESAHINEEISHITKDRDKRHEEHERQYHEHVKNKSAPSLIDKLSSAYAMIMLFGVLVVVFIALIVPFFHILGG